AHKQWFTGAHSGCHNDQPNWEVQNGGRVVEKEARPISSYSASSTLRTTPAGATPLLPGTKAGFVGWGAWAFLAVLITVIGLMPSTRAVSRMPQPLSALSTICRLVSGNRPVW